MPDLNVKPHGPLIEFSYNLFSNGMMMGTGSSLDKALEWKEDGTAVLTIRENVHGQTSANEYLVTPEAAQKVRDLVAEKHLEELADKEFPIMMYDNFVSVTIRMTFDDSSIGGSSRSNVTIQGGSYHNALKTLEEKIEELLKECEDTGEFIRTVTPEANIFANFLTEQGKWICSCGSQNTTKFCPNCGSPRPV